MLIKSRPGMGRGVGMGISGGGVISLTNRSRREHKEKEGGESKPWFLCPLKSACSSGEGVGGPLHDLWPKCSD